MVHTDSPPGCEKGVRTEEKGRERKRKEKPKIEMKGRQELIPMPSRQKVDADA